MRHLIEENLYWTMVHERWIVKDNWRNFRNLILSRVPQPARWIVKPIARRGVRRQLRGHDIGLHSRDVIHSIGRGDVAAVADFPSDKSFLMGEAASEIDAIA